MKGHIRQRSRGSYQISYYLDRDEFGKRRIKAETIRGTKAEAQRLLRARLSALDKGENPMPTNTPLLDWLDRSISE